MALNKIVMLADRRAVNVVKGGQIDEAISKYQSVYLPEMIQGIGGGKITDQQMVEAFSAGGLLSVGNNESAFSNLTQPPDDEDRQLMRGERMRQIRALYHAIHTAKGSTRPIAVAGLDPEVISHVKKLAKTDKQLAQRLQTVEMVGHDAEMNLKLPKERTDMHMMASKDGVLSPGETQFQKPNCTGIAGYDTNFRVKNLKEAIGDGYDLQDDSMGYNQGYAKNRETLIKTLTYERYRQTGLTHDQANLAQLQLDSLLDDNSALNGVLDGSQHPLEFHSDLLDEKDPARNKYGMTRTQRYERLPTKEQVELDGSADAARSDLRQFVTKNLRGMAAKFRTMTQRITRSRVKKAELHQKQFQAKFPNINAMVSADSLGLSEKLGAKLGQGTAKVETKQQRKERFQLAMLQQQERERNHAVSPQDNQRQNQQNQTATTGRSRREAKFER